MECYFFFIENILKDIWGVGSILKIVLIFEVLVLVEWMVG